MASKCKHRHNPDELCDIVTRDAEGSCRRGTRVAIINADTKPWNAETVGAIGTIINIVLNHTGLSCYGILLDEMKNERSGKGLYWFNRRNFIVLNDNCGEEFFDKEDVHMRLTGFNKVAVLSINDKDYYYALYDDGVAIDDYVMVTGMATEQIRRVKEVISLDELRKRYSGDITAEVMCRVDLSAYEKRIADRQEAKKLKEEMNRAIKQMDEVNKYEMYARNNPEFADMLARYKELVG